MMGRVWVRQSLGGRLPASMMVEVATGVGVVRCMLAIAA